MKTITVLLRNVFIVDMARVVFVRRADAFTSDVLRVLSLGAQPRQHGQQPAEAQPAPEAGRHVGPGLLAAVHRLTTPPRRRHHFRHHFRLPPARVR